MINVLIDKLQFKLDDWRVRQHFDRVENILNAQDVSHLSQELQNARKQHLKNLHSYAARGVFPRNHERQGYAPCFIDRDGRECAVAHIMMISGQTEVAKNIAAVANYAYVPEMNCPELDDWAAQTGLSREDLALIQPGYYMVFSDFLSLTIVVWAVGWVTILINLIQMARRGKGIIAPLLGFAGATLLLLLSLFCIYAAADAWLLVDAVDVPKIISDLASIEAGNFGLAAVISLVLGVLAGGLGYYGRRAFRDARKSTE